jgi:hypothetical protein
MLVGAGRRRKVCGAGPGDQALRDESRQTGQGPKVRDPIDHIGVTPAPTEAERLLTRSHRKQPTGHRRGATPVGNGTADMAVSSATPWTTRFAIRRTHCYVEAMHLDRAGYASELDLDRAAYTWAVVSRRRNATGRTGRRRRLGNGQGPPGSNALTPPYR